MADVVIGNFTDRTQAQAAIGRLLFASLGNAGSGPFVRRENIQTWPEDIIEDSSSNATEITNFTNALTDLNQNSSNGLIPPPNSFLDNPLQKIWVVVYLDQGLEAGNEQRIEALLNNPNSGSSAVWTVYLAKASANPNFSGSTDIKLRTRVPLNPALPGQPALI